MLASEDLTGGITCIDTGYTRPGMTACYLMEQDGRYAFIETGVNRNVDGLLDLLDHRDISYDQVDYVISTHVHLDHAGGAGALMQALPNAQLVIHPRGARHMVNPAALVAGATAVYGEAMFQQMYGEIVPVDPDRLIEAPDNFSLQLGARTLLFLDTPGHARHHFCIYDERSLGVFSGDTFGISYREFDEQGKILCFPTTTPVQFDPEALHDSIDRIVSMNPRYIYLTHYGCIRDPMGSADQLHQDIDYFVELVRQYEGGEQIEQQVADLMADYLTRRAAVSNPSLSTDDIASLLAHDIQLNAQGLVHWVNQ